MEKRKLVRVERPQKPKKKRLSRAERKAKLDAAQRNASSLFSQDPIETKQSQNIQPSPESQKPEETDSAKPEESVPEEK